MHISNTHLTTHKQAVHPDCNMIFLLLQTGKTQENMNTSATLQHAGLNKSALYMGLNRLAQSELYQHNADWLKVCTHHASSFHSCNIATWHD